MGPTPLRMRMLPGLLCALAVCAGALPVLRKDFSLEKAAGKWFVVGLATNAQWLVNDKAGMKMGTATFVPAAGGDLEMNYATLNADGTCWRMTNLAKKTDTPWHFTFHSLEWGNDNDLRMVEVEYGDFALVNTIKTKDGVSEVLNTLYSRTPDVSADLQKRFREFSLVTGILPDNIVLLPKNAECPEV